MSLEINIKDQVEELYDIIKDANDKLEEIRKVCPHTNTEIVEYQFRVGHIGKALICSACGKLQ